MQLAEGVLLVLDAAGTPFNRIWCCFEISMCMLEKDSDGARRLKFDVVTICHKRPSLIAEGLPGLDSTRHFPLPLLERGFELDIAKAVATRAEDKRRILNRIAGKEASELDTTEVPEEHATFDMVNLSLRNLFAEAAMPQSYRTSRETGKDMCRALMVDPERKVMLLNFGYNSHVDASAAARALSMSSPAGLLTLELRFKESKQLESASALAGPLGSLRALQRLVLDFAECEQLLEISSLVDPLASLKMLQFLHLNFSWCQQVADLSALGEALGELTALTHLELNFWWCPQIDGSCVSALFGHSFESLTALQHLDLDFSGHFFF